MSEIKFIWLGLHSDREKEIFTEGFWEGVAANQKIQDEVKDLDRQHNAKKTVQRTPDKVQQR